MCFPIVLSNEIYMRNVLGVKKKIGVGKIFGGKKKFVEENHLFRGGYAKISTDDRGIYFFTEGRRPEVK